MKLNVNISYKDLKGSMVVDIYDNVLENGFLDSSDYTMWGCPDIESLEKVKDQVADEIFAKYGYIYYMDIESGGRLDLFKNTSNNVMGYLKGLNVDEDYFKALDSVSKYSEDFSFLDDYDKVNTLEFAVSIIDTYRLCQERESDVGLKKNQRVHTVDDLFDDYDYDVDQNYEDLDLEL